MPYKRENAKHNSEHTHEHKQMVGIAGEQRQSAHDRGFSFFSLNKALKPQPATLTTLKRTPGISPTAWPRRPNPEIKTSSFSSMKFKQPSIGQKAAIFFPFLIS